MLESGLVTLRDVAETDLPIFFEQQRDPDAVRMAVFFSRDRNAFDAHWAKILVDPVVFVKTIEFQKNVAGNVGSFELQGQRYVGYWLGKGFWGKGIATQALMKFLREDRRRLQARVAKSNIASIRVLEKCGFTIAGEDRLAIQPGGEEVDDWVYERGGS